MVDKTMDFNTVLSEKIMEAESILYSYLPTEEGPQKTVFEAMNYSVKAGGKRLRPIMMKATYDLFEGDSPAIRPFMAALEMIHTYSLVHDDLEAMDNDEYRRGMKTTHVVYGEAMAILAGDGLLNFAFETAAQSFRLCPGDIACEKALMILGKKAGIYGMVGGQVADVEAEEKMKSLSMQDLVFIHENKTAALIQAALMIGALLAGANKEAVDSLEKIGYYVGIAFQIQDDILDVTSTLEELGKPIGSDEKNHKTTYVSLVGLEQSQEDVQNLSNLAMEEIAKLPGDTSFLSELVNSLIHRTK